MRQAQGETGEESGPIRASGFQLTLELLVFSGIAVLLFLIAARIPATRLDANVVLGIAVVLHATGLVRLAVRASDFAGQDEAR